MTPWEPGFLFLEDGTLFVGRLHAPHRTTVAEVVFTTNITGYQEVFTDPSYAGQIVVLTAPQIGNCGINDEDPESARPQISGVVVRELSASYSNWRADGALDQWLAEAQVPILTDVDTRRLTRHLRSAGVMRGAIGSGREPNASARAALAACPAMEGLDLASTVTTRQSYDWGKPTNAHHIIAYDYGIKRNILRLLDDHGCRVTVVPATTSAEAVLEQEPAEPHRGDALRKAGRRIGLDRKPAQGRRPGRRLEPEGRSAPQEALQRLLLGHADHRVVRAGHADIGHETRCRRRMCWSAVGDVGVRTRDDAERGRRDISPSPASRWWPPRACRRGSHRRPNATRRRSTRGRPRRRGRPVDP